jgi:tyrosyl-tRNA synthetase
MHTQADICQLGMDQRKVNVLAREYCDSIKVKHKPVILSHRMMPGLLEVRAPRASSAMSAVLKHRQLY